MIFFSNENLVRSITLILSRIFSWNLVQISSFTRWCRAKKNHNTSTFFVGLYPFEIISMKIVSAVQLKNRRRYFHETGYKNKLVSGIVHRTKTVTPPTIFVKLCPFEIFLMKTCLLYNSTTLKDIFMKLGTKQENENRNSYYVFCRIMPLWNY